MFLRRSTVGVTVCLTLIIGFASAVSAQVLPTPKLRCTASTVTPTPKLRCTAVTATPKLRCTAQTPTRTTSPGITSTPTQTRTTTPTPTATPTIVQERCVVNDWSKNRNAFEDVPGLSFGRIVTQDASSFFGLLTADIHNTRAETVQVALRITEAPTGIVVSQVIDVNPGPNRVIQLPYKFNNLSLGWHTFTAAVNQSASGPLVYQSDTTCLGIWDVSYETQIVNQLREIYWPVGAMQFDATYCAAPVGGLIASSYAGWYIICADNDGSTLYGDIKLPTAYDGTNVSFAIEAKETAGATGTLSFDFHAMCAPENQGNLIPPTSEAADATVTVTEPWSQIHAVTDAFTPDGDCSANPHLYWRATLNADATSIDMDNVRILGVTGNWNP